MEKSQIHGRRKASHKSVKGTWNKHEHSVPLGREYRTAHEMPIYEVERKIKKQSENELIAKNKELKKYDTMEEVKADIFKYIELFYNRKRLHSSLGYMSPAEYRLKYCV